MTQIPNRLLILSIFLFGFLILQTHPIRAQIHPGKQNNLLIQAIESTSGFIALWQLNEEAGNERKAIGNDKFPLKEVNGPVPRISEGPVSGYSIKLDGSNFLNLPNDQTQELNIHGKGKEVTVIAWVKWSGEQTGFVGGMWNEYADGGKRQYGLFVSLPHYNGGDQVCGHISQTGKPTPPFPYSIDYSASKQVVPREIWTCIAFTYDGEFIRSYVDGEFEAREPELIKNTIGFEGYPDGLTQSKNPYYYPNGMGNNGSDFTVGAVLLKRGMGNFFKGQIGGLAVFERALDENELKKLADLD
ncbi:LamG-like jellyroll fold domain-containing protein [Algoriphagus sp. A40]|uniref:LamG-like jellyroll fold domain-containing protein n=1 Tax=Algoriphagus sp. A40 TaxID=1945863 RepID=UPI0009872B10|nr:LamG-like jellyroll fold domain-containing protein [Algoriphagus sp. A40]OOG74352.1 hypothetical protein B0E43_12170 [Algoriphagus sp. A40]